VPFPFPTRAPTHTPTGKLRGAAAVTDTAVTDAAVTVITAAAAASALKMVSLKRRHNSRTQARNARGQFAPKQIVIDIYSDSSSDSDSDPVFNLKPATKTTMEKKMVRLNHEYHFWDLGLQTRNEDAVVAAPAPKHVS